MSQISFPETAESDLLELEHIPDASIQNPHYQEYLKLSQKEWTFADFLPMNIEKTILTNNDQKIKVLNLLYHCYRSANDALQAFYIDKKPELFDAHVGESACQIRAIKLAVMLKHMQEEDCEKARIQAQVYMDIAHRIIDVINQYQVSHIQIEGSILISDFFKKYELNYFLKQDDLFLLLSFILSAFKKRMAIDQQMIDFKFLSSAWNISRKYSENQINHIQKIGSLLSVDYVLRQSALKPIDMRLLSCQLQKNHIGRWMLPCLETIRFMLDLMKIHKISALVQVFIEGSDGFKLTYQYLCKNNFFLSIKAT